MKRADYDELDSPDGVTYYWMDTPDGITYRFTQEKLFTGIAYQMRPEGQLWNETEFLDGREHARENLTLRNESMNLSPNPNFRVTARLQYWEVPDEVALFYTGVLAMTLNQLVGVLFVPHTQKNAQNWPPVLPDNTDAIQSPEEARLVSLGMASYAVTPDEERAGQEELLHSPGGYDPMIGTFPPSQSVIFYTTQQQYEQLSDEVLMFAAQMPSYRVGVRVSEMKQTFLQGFLFSRILASSHFAPRHRKILEDSSSK